MHTFAQSSVYVHIHIGMLVFLMVCHKYAVSLSRPLLNTWTHMGRDATEYVIRNVSLLEHSCIPNAPGSFPYRQHNFNRKLHVHAFLLPQVKSNIHTCFITVGCTNFMCGEHQIECALQVHMYMYSTCTWSTGQSLSLEVTVVHILLRDTLRESTVRLVPVLAHNDIYTCKTWHAAREAFEKTEH